jgi:hypothetical protein
MEKVQVTIRSLVPMLMHNGQLADPLCEHASTISDAVKSAKKNKTRAAWMAAYQAEFAGGLYLDEDMSPCLPGEVIEAALVEAAKKTKQGKQVKAGVFVDGNFPLQYKGPRDVAGLWDAKFYKTQSARVGQNRIMRTRPMFTDWACTFVVHYNEQLLSKKDILSFVDLCGREIGVGYFRPRYGRFEVVK